jgi:tetratricopeptide (TPR) repeat protein
MKSQAPAICERRSRDRDAQNWQAPDYFVGDKDYACMPIVSPIMTGLAVAFVQDRSLSNEDPAMKLSRFLRHLSIAAVAALLVAAVGMKPIYAAGTDNPPPVSDDKKKDKKGSAIEEQQRQLAHEQFLRGYRAAREMILAGDYKSGIAALHALGHDEHPDVANYIGYANRKLGNYDQSKIWYEAALKADPNHTRTWSYFGMWHMEQGNRLMANDYLAKVNVLCGNSTCEEYRQLKAVIDGTASY